MQTKPKPTLDEARAAYDAAQALHQDRQQNDLGTALGRILQTAPAYIAALEAGLEAERETRRQWGRERQTALDQLRWARSAIRNHILECETRIAGREALIHAEPDAQLFVAQAQEMGFRDGLAKALAQIEYYAAEAQIRQIGENKPEATDGR